MQRILIADASGTVCDIVHKQLAAVFSVVSCNNGQSALEMIDRFDPDVLVIDLMLPDRDGLDILSTLRSAGCTVKVLAITSIESNYILTRLQQLDVQHVLKRPCSPDCLVHAIRQLTLCTDAAPWCVDTEIDDILLKFSFNPGPSRYDYVHTAILLRYHGVIGGMMKCLYPAVAKQYGGNALQIEKAIRDAIQHAWKTGNRAMWNLYFPVGEKECCPSNEMFIARIALALRSRDRIKKPYDPHLDQAANR